MIRPPACRCTRTNTCGSTRCSTSPATRGLRTAWSDKHPAYEILNGPSGTGVQDLFTPEINSVADAAGDDWTTDNALTQEYDSTKVAAILNEINGFDHSGAHRVGTPAIFGMNFQTVSTAAEAPASPTGSPAATTPTEHRALAGQALDYINTQVGDDDRGHRSAAAGPTTSDHPVGQARPIARST